ncbi:MAG: glycoside hydrolase family 97 catalytic domain-containing protein [Propionibacteriaceae bacterium]|jgi:alpha-glucosidase|nr:glycoside hydrolase family 97 catalytic domain-containing protein [Propionibacteriaceae bacterium]
MNITSRVAKLTTSVIAVVVVGLMAMGTSAPAMALTVHEVTSPDGLTSLTVRNENDGTLTYTITQAGQSVVDSSRMGVVTASVDLSTRLSFLGESQRTVSQEYSLTEHFDGAVTSTANEMTLSYARGSAKLTVVIRAANDGVAFHYEVSGVGSTAVTAEATTFALPGGTGLWASDYRSARDYEATYPYVSASSMGTRHFAMPMLGSLRNNTGWMLISEAGVYNNGGQYPAVRLDAQGNGNSALKVQLPGPDNNVFSTATNGVQVPTTGSFATPWRVVVAAPSLDDLTRSHLITDLNPDPVGDYSWVKPGKALWSWWSNEEHAAAGDDMVLSQKSYIDSAEELGMDYVTVDCCYVNNGVDIPTLASYGAERGIGVFIWKNKGDFTNGDGSYFGQSQLDAALRGIADQGVAGLKIDFMQSDRADTMGLYERIAIAAQKARLLVNFHGSTKPSGENRTYPNIITSEAILGSEQYKYRRAPKATDDATYPFTRNVVGGMDMTPVVFSLDSLNTTHAHQLALSVVFTSAMVHFADSNAAYETWVGRHLLRAVPTVWDESKMLEGFPDDYATFARRTGDDWFIGSVNDGARTSTIPLSFLGSGHYKATVFKDGASDRDIATEVVDVTSASTLTIPERAHGGYAVHISKTPLAFDGVADVVLEAELPTNTLAGAAAVSSCAGCSGQSKVGYLGTGASVTFNGVQAATAGPRILRIGYLDADQRAFSVSVNGGEAVVVNPPRSGNASGGTPSGWGIVRDVDVPVTLAAGLNAITIGGVDGHYAPDIDRIIMETVYTPVESVGVGGWGLSGVNAQNSGSTTAQIEYTSATGGAATVLVDGVVATQVELPATAGASSTSSATVYLDLTAGNHAVTITSPTSSFEVTRLIVRQ